MIELNSETKPYLDRDLQISLYNNVPSKSTSRNPPMISRTKNSDVYYTGYDYDFESSYASFREQLYTQYGPSGPSMFGSAAQRVRYANQGAKWVWATMIFNEEGDWAHEFLSS